MYLESRREIGRPLNNEMIAVISINIGISKEQFSTGALLESHF